MELDRSTQGENTVKINNLLEEVYHLVEQLEQEAQENRQRFQQEIEAGEILTTEGQSSGQK
ncbi:hypothetical protein [Coleofasciculus sp. H7-2]|uniref:hypothetical protein n=1 Tax=Coleofasciculus sp. H7-2 TaxID=3351545 RepID=UPI00366BD3C3